MNLWKKKSLFWSVIFSYSTQQWTISWLDCDVWQKVNFIWWPVMTSSVAGLRRSSKAVPKAKLVPKKIIAPVWLSVAHLIHYTLWIPVKPLHLRSMLSKSMRCTENCNACNRHWSTERNQFSMTMPIHTLHNQCLKSGANWPIKFCLIYHICPTSHQLIITSFSNILRGKCFHNQ